VKCLNPELAHRGGGHRRLRNGGEIARGDAKTARTPQWNRAQRGTALFDRRVGGEKDQPASIYSKVADHYSPSCRV
jgi:hypothetical protein